MSKAIDVDRREKEEERIMVITMVYLSPESKFSFLGTHKVVRKNDRKKRENKKKKKDVDKSQC